MIKATFNVVIKGDLRDESLNIPDVLKLVIKDRVDAADLIRYISNEISKPSNEEINIYLLGEYVRTKED